MPFRTAFLTLIFLTLKIFNIYKQVRFFMENSAGRATPKYRPSFYTAGDLMFFKTLFFSQKNPKKSKFCKKKYVTKY